ncbi:MAG: MBL fold metallo-hydrolase [Propionibacteriaceae bacterium]|jgi:glyoxylase-like metal-dependent hydrolase (beta-lactamase superfamily II)|nr:MBL fold metallo-hydrolase [Propionibacteriaceae bacterium]
MAKSFPVLELPQASLRQLAVSAMDNNVYLLTSRATGSQILIDAADQPEAILELLEAARPDAAVATRLCWVVTTHQHWDHLRALAQVVARTAAATAAGADDAAAITRQTDVAIDRPLAHGDRLEAPGLALNVIGLRGHTPGSVALAWDQPGQPRRLFSGDSLFPGGVGNTDRDPARFRRLLADVQDQVFATHDDATIVLPGHGRPTTLGAERPHLAEWSARGW